MYKASPGKTSSYIWGTIVIHLGDHCEHESNMQTLHVVGFVTFCQNS